MDFIDIVPSELVNLTHCEPEAIHTPGHIQPHGILLTLQEPELIILQASKNTEELFGIPAESLINQSLEQLLNKRQIAKLKKCLIGDTIEIHNPLKLSVNCLRNSRKIFESLIHRKDGLLIMELEPSLIPEKYSSLSFYHLAKQAIQNVKKANNLQEITNLIAKEIRKITGFDRVMVYQFEPDESGVVIAEDKREGLEAYLGLHYPAADIPALARKLYYQNWLRLIVDMNYQPVPIIPSNNPLTDAPLDLSFSVLRSVSPIHVKYLQNMGVSASFSISLLNERKLWGMIVCHHYLPKYVAYEIRKVCELLGQIMSIEIVNKQQQEMERYEDRIKLIQTELQNQLAKQNFSSQIFQEKATSLLELVKAQGAIVSFGKDITLFGKTPSVEEARALIVWLQSYTQKEVFHTNNLSRIYNAGKKIKDVASGLLAISIFVNETTYHIIWLRPEVIQTVNWAGDPQKPMIIENDGTMRLSPRRSFELWKETVREKALPWQEIEIDAAAELRNGLMLAVLEFYQLALQQAAIKAQAANRAKSQFLAKMSHELRTPLNAILGFTQILTHHSELNKEQQEYLGIIGRSGEHLLSLINDVLEMSKIEAGLVTLNENSFDLYRLLDELEEMLQLKAQTKGLLLVCDRRFDIPQYVKTDESKLRQVLINLLANAIKFTQKGRVKLQVKVKEESCSVEPSNSTLQCQLLFTIEDTGPGIAPEEMSHLFEPFFQSETGRRSMEGTGLGLPISRQFVQLMGGDIRINSQLGKGTVVKFDINVNSAISWEKKTEDDPGQAIALAPGQPGYRILIVEDSYESRKLLHQLLAKVGFEVWDANNGKEAVTLSLSWQPHLIWMDMQMPVMDGLEATKQIKQEFQKLNLHSPTIIAITASAFEEDRDHILKAGCDDYMSKPFHTAEIFEKMAKYLGVRYLYEKATPNNLNEKVQMTATVEQLTAADLSIMPVEWLAKVRHAAICADDEQLLELIAKIPIDQVKLVNKLTDLVHEFQFDEITKLSED